MAPKPKREDYFTYVLLFDKGSGSPKVNYLMIDPRAPSLMLPKMNTIIMNRLNNISGYRTVVLDNYLYVIGGKDWTTGEYLTTVRRCDLQMNGWKDMHPLETPRCRFTASVLNGYIYIIGGESLHGRVIDSVERFDPKKNRWRKMTPIPRPRADHAVCNLNGCLYVSGGISNLRHNCSNVFWMYNVADDVWSEPLEGIALPTERDKHNMISVGMTKIFVLGAIPKHSLEKAKMPSSEAQNLRCHFTSHMYEKYCKPRFDRIEHLWPKLEAFSPNNDFHFGTQCSRTSKDKANVCQHLDADEIESTEIDEDP
ncbi:hypothetical protein LOTGIDRAFT_154977 [Lottia gigantea]|uniref:Uncharacterized protein n=1 Tax=Lottia gigantea TaxID=225164 RepID=V3ZMF6_LOTGI|nr:hypothetical protein LOTGIDRAFT_154977 [Lottia gigantea]ESO85487.1 hypothetical protein LOTGIDRAFT_154977 [Lottia gigantea]